MSDEPPLAPEPAPAPSASADPDAVCEICGSTKLAEIRCKTICLNCHTILKTCSDL